MANYTILELDEVDNLSSNGEMRMMRNDLDSDQVSLTYRRIPAGYKSAHGHTHSEQDEVIFVWSGNLQVKLDDEVVELGPKMILRIAPETKRGYHNDGGEDVEMVIASAHGELVDDNGGTPDEDWWPDK